VIDAGVMLVGAAAGVWLADGRPGLSTDGFAVFGAALGLALLVVSARLDLYHPWRTATLPAELLALAQAATVSLALATTAMVVASGTPGATTLLALLAGALVAVLLVRTATRLLIRRWRVRGDDYRLWLIVGDNERSEALVADLLAHPRYGIRIAAWVDVGDPPPARPATPRPGGLACQRLEGPEALRTLLGSTVVDEVLITLPLRSRYDLVEQLAGVCAQAGISVKTLAEAFVLPGVRHHVAHVGGVPMLTHYSGPGNYGQLLVKRVIDLFGAGVGLVLLAPLLLMLALAVKLTSPGAVLYGQTRVGLHGRHFRMLKFRSMHTDAAARLASLAAANQRDGTAFKLRDDPRITPAGRWMRRFHLDELPQLWNVLVGDMSLVGPRPLQLHEAHGDEWWQRRRLTVPPGLTCFWQLADDPSIPFHQWMRMDMDYIDRWSLWLDLKIIFLTFATLARGRGW
jgi:exopolysaccharide biosynthesis polyprenyl glycosylphosphotransferase